MWNNYPYINENDLNLDYILKKLKQLKDSVETFIATETITFADPILWNIASQYAKNTIVLSNSGDAYLSKQTVPANIQLDNTDYWQEIFNFADYVRTANSNLTFNVELGTTRATRAYSVDDWILWDDVLYKALTTIAVDELFVVDTNIEHFTVEDFCTAWVTSMQSAYNSFTYDSTQTINQYKNDIDASEAAYIAAIQTQVNQIISGSTSGSEVINARVGINAVDHGTLKLAIVRQISAVYFELYNLMTAAFDIENLYDLNNPTVVNNYAVNQDTGAVFALTDWSYLYMPVIGGRSLSVYSENATPRFLIAFYQDGVIMANQGQNITGNSVFTVPTGAQFMAVTTRTADMSTTRFKYDSNLLTEYAPFGELSPAVNSNIASVSALTSLSDQVNDGFTKLSSLFKFGKWNLYDDTDTTEGYYVDPNTGTVTSAATFCYYAIPVTAGLDYSIAGGRHLTCYKDADGLVVAGGADHTPDEVKTTPAGAVVMYVSTAITDRENIIVAQSSTIVTEPDLITRPSDLLKVIQYVHISVSTASDLRSTLEGITDSAYDKRYVIEVAPGTYDIESAYTSAEISASGFKGLFVPPYCKVLGVGGRGNVTLKWDSATPLSQVSVLNIYLNSELENITFYGNNVRYAVHDDFEPAGWTSSNDDDFVRHIKNCIFEIAASPLLIGYGAGYRNGVKWHFENCTFITAANGAALYMHNQVNFTQAAQIVFDNCRFIGNGVGYDMSFSSLTNGSTVFNDIILKGCGAAHNKIKVGEDNPNVYGTGIRVNLSGYANTFGNSDVSIIVTDGVDYSSHIDLI